MLKNGVGQGFYLSYNYSCTLYLLVKIKEVKLKNLPASVYLNLNYGTATQKPPLDWCRSAIAFSFANFTRGATVP